MNNPNQPAAETLHDTWQSRNSASPDWLQTLQKNALSEFSQTGFPTTRMEDWKYTDLSAVAAISRRWIEAGHGPGDASLAVGLAQSIRDSLDAHWLVIINGTVPDIPADGLPGALYRYHWRRKPVA